MKSHRKWKSAKKCFTRVNYISMHDMKTSSNGNKPMYCVMKSVSYYMYTQFTI